MKTSVLFLCLLCITIILNAQDRSERKNKIQIDFGLSNTLHYKPPVNINFCYEPCYPEEQRSKISKNFELGFYRQINRKNEIRLGVGLTEYRFTEKGVASRGDINLFPYQYIVDLDYFTASVGHRLSLEPWNKLLPYFENSLYYDSFFYKDYILKPGSFAFKTKAGFLATLTKNIDLSLSGFFKSAIARYNKPGFGDSYLPYGYGLEFGIRLGI